MPTSLQGLNIVYPSPPPSDNQSQDLLIPPAGLLDLSAQLDLWTNLSFASDEPFIPNDREEPKLISELEHKFRDEEKAENPPENDNRHLIATRDKPAQTAIIDNSPLSTSPNTDQSPFDLGSFLAGFGIDPFLVPPQASQPSLLSSAPSTSSNSSPSDISSNSNSRLEPDGPPPSKRTRTRKDSIASSVPVISPSALQERALGNDIRAVSEFSDDHDPLTTPLTAAEDKRRRNTAASARFRAKKKEREQALEKRSKELETKVTELERECEGLRRENGWLKGLVVGVTSGNPTVPVDSSGGSGDSSETNKDKRKRDSDSN